MKNLFQSIVLSGLFLTIAPTDATALNDPVVIKAPAIVHVNEPNESDEILNRLTEIKGMDRSEMTRTEKRELRKEVRELRQEISGNNRGVFISVGSLLLIALLLIILL